MYIARQLNMESDGLSKEPTSFDRPTNMITGNDNSASPISTSSSSNISAKFFGHHTPVSISPQSNTKQSINNMTTGYSAPQFFDEAMKANDIVINAEAEKKRLTRKKIIICSTIIGIVAVIILIISVVVNLIKLSSNSSDGAISKQTITLYNSFSNYLLFGEDKTDSVDLEYEYGSMYYYTLLDTDDARDTYIKTAINKFNAFEESYQKDNVDNEELSTKISDYEKNIDLFFYTEKYPIISDGDLMSFYIENGKDETKKKLQEYFGKYSESSFDQTKKFGKDYESRSIGILTVYDTLKTNGCINTDIDVISKKCLNNPNSTYSGSISLASDFSSYYKNKRTDLLNLSKNIYRDVWKIGKAISDEA